MIKVRCWARFYLVLSLAFPVATIAACEMSNPSDLTGDNVTFSLGESSGVYLPSDLGYPQLPIAVAATVGVAGCHGRIAVTITWNGTAAPTSIGLAGDAYLVQTHELLPPACMDQFQIRGPVPPGTGIHQVCAKFMSSGDNVRSCRSFRVIPLCDAEARSSELCFIGGMGPGPSDPSQQTHVALQADWNSLMAATLTFNIPKSVSLSKSDFVVAYVSITRASVPPSEGSGPTTNVPTRVSNKVSLSLTPDDKESMDVEQVVGTSMQTVIEGAPSKWEWRLAAKAPGDYKLRLQQFDELSGDGVDIQQLVEDKEIEISVPDDLLWRFEQQVRAITLLQWLELLFGTGFLGGALVMAAHWLRPRLLADDHQLNAQTKPSSKRAK